MSKEMYVIHALEQLGLRAGQLKEVLRVVTDSSETVIDFVSTEEYETIDVETIIDLISIVDDA